MPCHPSQRHLCALQPLSLGSIGENLESMLWVQHLPREREDTRAVMSSLQTLEILLLGLLGRCNRLLTDLLFDSLAFLFAWAFNIPQIPLSLSLLSYSHLLHTR